MNRTLQPLLDPIVRFSFCRKRPKEIKTTAVDESIHIRPHDCQQSTDMVHHVKKALVIRHEESSSTVGIPEDDDDNLRRQATSVAEKIYKGTNHQIIDKSSLFPKFKKRQILMGKILGKGAYCNVSEVRGFQHLNELFCEANDVKSEPFTTVHPPVSLASFLQENIRTSSLFLTNGKWLPSIMSRMANDIDKKYLTDDEVAKESRDFIADHCFRNGGDARYAIKCLNKNTIENPRLLLQGIIDMATEARILSHVTDHPNVIKMRAVSDSGPFGGSDGFFIILDRLYDTLEKRLLIWKKKHQRLTGISAKMFRRDPWDMETDQLQLDRLVAAYDLSSALAYLHKNRVIHRDVKPANIGFDVRGDIKIFDFGLARSIPRSNDVDEDVRFAFTAMCGTLRYMAPEVGLGQPYNQSCDTFSFSILLWEMMTMERPYGSISPEELQSQVWGPARKRPAHISVRGRSKRKNVMTAPLLILMKRGWSFNPEERPKMVHIEGILRRECVSFRNGDESGLEHNQRRSTHVFHRSTTTRTL